MVLMAGCSDYRPEALRCEYQDGLVLVDTDSPRLSWINSTDQTACQIIVSTDRKMSGKGLVWDSGKVASGESHLVPYGSERPGRKMREVTGIPGIRCSARNSTSNPGLKVQRYS